MSTFFSCSLLASSLFAQDDFGEPPDEPDEPFLVFVVRDQDSNESLQDAGSELERRFAKNKRWFRLADSADASEIVVRLLSHTTHDERRVRSIWGVVPPTEDRQPSKTQVVEIETHHNLRSQVEFFGAATSMTGTRVRTNGGSSKDAARDLAERIQRYCKENYWSLMKRRAARQSAHPNANVPFLEAIIDERGRVSAVRVLRSIPTLDQSAIDAVRRWRYEPTLINGEPVPVLKTVTVEYKMS